MFSFSSDMFAKHLYNVISAKRCCVLPSAFTYACVFNWWRILFATWQCIIEDDCVGARVSRCYRTDAGIYSHWMLSPFQRSHTHTPSVSRQLKLIANRIENEYSGIREKQYFYFSIELTVCNFTKWGELFGLTSISILVFHYSATRMRARHRRKRKRKSNWIVNFVCHPRLATNNSTIHLKRVSFPFIVRFSVVGNTSVKHGWFFVLVGNLLINQTKHGVTCFSRTTEQAGGGRRLKQMEIYSKKHFRRRKRFCKSLMFGQRSNRWVDGFRICCCDRCSAEWRLNGFLPRLVNKNWPV